MNHTNMPGNRRASRIGRLSLFSIPILIVAIVVVRVLAYEVDFALANIMTAILALLMWGASIIALYNAKRLSRGLWKVVLAAPLVALGVVLSLFRVERLDSELKPQLRPRWQAARDLPIDSDQPVIVETDADPRFVARSTDFPQFLGKDRDAIVRGLALDPDWETNPPRILWKQPIGDGWSGFAVQGDVAVTMEQRDQQEWVSAYAVSDGQMLWHYPIDARHTHIAGGTGPRSTPTIAFDRVYACSAVSRLACLELATGMEVWSHELNKLVGITQAEFEEAVTWGRAGSPLIFEESVIIPLGGVGKGVQPLVAFDAMTGAELWRGGLGQISYASPVLAEIQEVPQVLLVAEDHVAAFVPETGEELWRFAWPGASDSSASVSQPVVINDTDVLTTKGYGQGARLTRIGREDEQWMTETIWENRRSLRTKFTNCVVRDGFAYGLSDGILECVEVATGERQWKRGRFRHGQLLLVAEHLLISSESGEIVLVEARPDDFVELASFPAIGDVTWNTLTLSGERLLIRNSDEVACLAMPLLSSPSIASEATIESAALKSSSSGHR